MTFGEDGCYETTYSELPEELDALHDPQVGRFYFEASKGDEAEGNLPGARPLPKSCSLWGWATTLIRQVLATRTSLAAFLRTTFRLRRNDVPASAIFPIPAPFPDAFDRMPHATSSSRRLRLVRQVIHVVAMTLNFWWNGGSFLGSDLLERTPSPVHRSMFRRWKCLLLADGPCGVFDIASSGRKFPQLGARINELSTVLTKLGAAGGPYAHVFPGHEVPLDNALLDGLEPYRSLDVSRLKLSGRGLFDATEFLDEDLVMAYRCPDLLQYEASSVDFSAFLFRRDPPDEVLKLAKLWDSQGLLSLNRVDLESHAPHELTRVFNCLKDSTCDRQIGDRRGRNETEGRLQAASKTLPNGPDLLELFVPPGKKICVSVTDRRDFYHQFWTTQSRAVSNSVGPALPLSLLSDLGAMSVLAAGENAKKKFKRLRCGDGLGRSARQGFGILQDKALICFKSILQGDHL